jgi:hypothetical protein
MNLVTLTFQVTPEQRRLLKMLSAQSGQPLRALMIGQIERLILENESRPKPQLGETNEPRSLKTML